MGETADKRKERAKRLLEVLVAAFPDRGQAVWNAVRKKRCLHLPGRAGRGAALSDVRRALEASGADDAEELLFWAESNTDKTCTAKMDACLSQGSRTTPPPCVARLVLGIIGSTEEATDRGLIDARLAIATLQREEALAGIFVAWLSGWLLPAALTAAREPMEAIPAGDWRDVLAKATPPTREASLRLKKRGPPVMKWHVPHLWSASLEKPLERARKVLPMKPSEREELSDIVRAIHRAFPWINRESKQTETIELLARLGLLRR